MIDEREVLQREHDRRWKETSVYASPPSNRSTTCRLSCSRCSTSQTAMIDEREVLQGEHDRRQVVERFDGGDAYTEVSFQRLRVNVVPAFLEKIIDQPNATNEPREVAIEYEQLRQDDQ